MIGKVNHGNLLGEKTLWQIYRASQCIKDAAFNWILSSIVLLCFGAYSFAESDIARLHNLLMKIAEVGLNCSVGLLGFLIAGFTIFSTCMKAELLLLMSVKIEKKTGLTYLKYNYFTFFRVFIYFLTLIFLQIFIILFGQKESFGDLLLSRFPESRKTVELGCRLLLAFYATFWIFTFLQLKSFVYNVYHIVMTMIKFEAVLHNESLLPAAEIEMPVDTEESTGANQTM